MAAALVTSLWIMIPATLLLAATLLALVVRAARRGEYDDWEGPAARMLHDDDSTPEFDGESVANDDPERGHR
jgi:cbb3-type cytochrome oxidase maturation protein